MFGMMQQILDGFDGILVPGGFLIWRLSYVVEQWQAQSNVMEAVKKAAKQENQY